MNPVRAIYSEEEINSAFEILETWLGVRRGMYAEASGRKIGEEEKNGISDRT